MRTSSNSLIAALFLISLYSVTTVAQNQFSKTSGETRELLAAMDDVRTDKDKLTALFRIGDIRTKDLVHLFDDPDLEISLRAQVIVRYIGNEAGMKALHTWYRKQSGEISMAGPVPQPMDDWDYNFVNLNLIANSPQDWDEAGVKYIYALALDGTPRAKTLLTELNSRSKVLDETNVVGNVVRRMQTIEPKTIVLVGDDLGAQVLRNAFFVAPRNRKYATSRVLAFTDARDKALIEVYINRGTLAEEWFHVVLKRCDQGWQYLSVTSVGVS